MKADNFFPLRNKTRQYQNKETGEVISRWAYQKIQKGGIDPRLNAKLNRITNPELSASLPARGRKSILKLPENERAVIAKARIEDRAQREAIAKELKETKKLERIFKRETNKKVHRKKVRPQLLKTGSKGARISLNNYGDYLVAFNEGKNATVMVKGKREELLIAYGLGMVGLDGDGKKIGFTVFTMRAFDSPLSEEDFYGAMGDELSERAYFTFSHYFMHLAFNINYARDRIARTK